MPFLASFLVSIFGSLLSYLTSRFAKSIAITIATVAIITGLASGLYYLLRSLTSGIAASVTNEWVLIGMGIVWPHNAEACVAAIAAAELAVYIYRLKKYVYTVAVPKA